MFCPHDLFPSLANQGSDGTLLVRKKCAIKQCPRAGPKAGFFLPSPQRRRSWSDIRTNQNKCHLCWCFYIASKKAAPPSTASLSSSSLTSSPRLPLLWALSMGKAHLGVSCSIKYLHLTTSEEIPEMWIIGSYPCFSIDQRLPLLP